ncbi:SMI1/KNR4 family protein [Streptacidiphilus sp. N1-10]|uniref:SMI1/KNR4 family protein n=1 Tax=Streptacidiphilus jeojiensis TaxID=3229225 RepID=A0ABV6XEE4_9ACTN
MLLLPQGPVSDTAAVVAAARGRLAQLPERSLQREGVGKVLKHLLVHGFDARPPAAKAIAELTPSEVPGAVTQLAGFLADRGTDPNALRGDDWWDEHPPAHEGLLTLVALALLDRPAYLDAAEQAFRTVGGHPAAECAAGFALLGPAQEAEAVRRLRSIAGSEPGGTAALAVRALLALGRIAETAEAVADCSTRGVALTSVIQPLVSAPPELLPVLVEAHLEALSQVPQWHLADRGSERPDSVSEVLSCGAEYRDRVRDVLRSVVRSSGQEPGVRWQAAERLALVSQEEQAQAATFLEAAGVVDPLRPLSAPPEPVAQDRTALRAAVTGVWGRIERQLADRFPGFEVRLGAAATPEEITAVEAELGVQLPHSFVESLQVHRSVAFGGLVQGMPEQSDVSVLPANSETERANDYWSSDRPDTEIRQDRGGRRGWIPVELEPDGSSTRRSRGSGPTRPPRRSRSSGSARWHSRPC